MLSAQHSRANIGHITRLRINEDGPGVRSVVFMCACPLNCLWCCNPELCASERFKSLTVDELYSYIAKDVIYFKNSVGGVTFSGGEPLLHTDFIKNFIQKYCKDFSVAIETSLYTDRDTLKKLIPLIDRWYIDFKVFEEKKHLKYTGVSNEIIKENLRYLCEHINQDKITVTYPMIPGYNTTDENLTQMIVLLKELNIFHIELHPYRKEQEEKHLDIGLEATVIEELDPELYNDIQNRFLQNGFQIQKLQPYREKEKCKYLKDIRKELCRKYQIPLDIKNCSFEGRCVGTCPQCEYELQVINEWFKNNWKGNGIDE
ncbi:MAG: radical SAM protein [Ruminococcaceae bacterium]|nr:radical SAM protein [Oscillospiraceae bacterium]